MGNKIENGRTKICGRRIMKLRAGDRRQRVRGRKRQSERGMKRGREKGRKRQRARGMKRQRERGGRDGEGEGK